jgi:hypothetical protein
MANWAERFYDMRFSAEEATGWERLVRGGMSCDEATEEMLRRRRRSSGWPSRKAAREAGLYRVEVNFDSALQAASGEAERVGRPVEVVAVDDGRRVVVDADRHWWFA